jgi:transcriptional regulator with XRE-family HTH domain
MITPLNDSRPYPVLVMARPTSKRATDFGNRLAHARKAAGLTQSELAARLGVSQQMIDYYERRASNPTAAFIQKAAKALNISSDELLGHAVTTTRKAGPPSELERRLLAVRKLPRPKQKLVLQFLDSFLLSNKNGKAD